MKKILSLLLVLTLVFAMAGCSKKDSGADKLVIGVDDSYPPMEYRDENNELIGFDVDFATALAAELGVEVEFVSTAWDGIFLGLESDKYDAIISSVSTTTERLENYDFSKPYLSNGQVIIVRPDSEMIESPEQLEGKVVGVQLETTADIAAKKQQESTTFELKQYDSITETFADLKTERLDAIVVDYAVALDYSTKSPGEFVITSTQLTNEPIAVCMKKGNTELKDKVNAAIVTLQESGKMKEISEKWFAADYTSNIDEELR